MNAPLSITKQFCKRAHRHGLELVSDVFVTSFSTWALGVHTVWEYFAWVSNGTPSSSYSRLVARRLSGRLTFSLLGDSE